MLSLQTANETFQVQSDLLQYQIELQTKLLVAREVIELSHERQGEVIDRQMRMEPNQPAVTTEVPGGDSGPREPSDSGPCASVSTRP